MKRGIYSLILILILFLNPVLIAQEGIETSYTCLENQLKGNCGDTKNTEQLAFNLLAGAYNPSIQSDCKSSLIGNSKTNCWGETQSSSCKIKETSLGIFALNYISEDISDYVNWLLEQKSTNTGLTWYLEIDTINESKCEINGKQITIEENKKITGSNPAGLTKAYNNYFFEIKDNSKNYTITCESDFITALLYQKPGSNVFYVPSKTNSISAGDSITEKVNSYCFSLTNTCDYEASLWAVLALSKTEEEISPYLPYLSAFYDDNKNKEYLPSSFLYTITGADDYYSELISNQKQGKYWDESRNRIYDTSLALLALQDIGTEEVENTKSYLLDLRKEDGCWNAYTSLILFSGWPKLPSISSSSETTISYCEDYDHYCVSRGECSNPLTNFQCPGAEVCCDTAPKEETCSEKQGQVCEEGFECSGSEVMSSDEPYCCLGSCIEEEEEENDCEAMDFTCQQECYDSQEEKTAYTDFCDIGYKCCADKKEETSNSWILIILLIILIILVILAIIFRNQLKVWWFKFKSKFKSGKPPNSGSKPGPGKPFSPPSFNRPSRRPPVRPSRVRPSRVRPSRDKDFEDTMKKLREMSK